MPLSKKEAQEVQRIRIVACGTAYHAGLVGKHAIEKLAGIPVEVEIASEYRYEDPITQPGTLFISVSQSGETADTIAALREAKRRGALTLAISNVVGSSLTREADRVIYTWAGPEIAVASTKAYVSQIMVLYALAADFAHKRGAVDESGTAAFLDEVLKLPEAAKATLELRDECAKFANRRFGVQEAFFIGRNIDYALAVEASLKLKEISYIHAEAYAAGELKHGTLALVEKGTLVVALATNPALIEKTISNIQEVKVRGAYVLAIACQGKDNIGEVADEVWRVPVKGGIFAPAAAIIPLQMLAYYMALERGCDIDKPRNLAKSVTVE